MLSSHTDLNTKSSQSVDQNNAEYRINLLLEQRIADFRPRLVRFLLTRISDHARVEDIAQDAMLVTIEKLRAGKIDNTNQLEAYVKKTAHYISIAWLRKKGNQVELRDDIDTECGPDVDPCVELMRRQLWGTVCHQISVLPVDRDRELMTRYYVRGQTKTEICGELALKALAFDRIANRARDRLKAQAFC